MNFLQKLPKDLWKKENLWILLLSGILLLVIVIPTERKEEESRKSEKTTEYQGSSSLERYIRNLEQELEEILALTEHAGKVRVMVTLKDNGEKVVEKDTESTAEEIEEEDSTGGSRMTNHHTVKLVSVYNSEEGSESGPYISKEKCPEVEGVLVIAEGGDNAIVVRNITEAIQALFDIDTHKIKVIKGNGS